MDVVIPYFVALAALLLASWLQERWKLGTLIWDHTVHFGGMCYLAAMRHTGQSRYTYKARRYRP